MEKTESFNTVLNAAKKDDKGKRDLVVQMKDLTFLAKDIQEYSIEDGEKQVTTQLKAQISVPDMDAGKRIRLGFCANSFRQFSNSHLGIPWKYLMKCPANLAREQVNYWKSLHHDKDLLIRLRDEKEPYARAILNATYGRLDNTPFLNMLREIVEEADLKVCRYDIDDHSMHVRGILPDRKSVV